MLAGGLSVAEGTFKARAITALSDKLRSELDVLRAQSGEEAERLLTLQAELARRREDIERSLRDMRAERGGVGAPHRGHAGGDGGAGGVGVRERG